MGQKEVEAALDTVREALDAAVQNLKPDDYAEVLGCFRSEISTRIESVEMEAEENL